MNKSLLFFSILLFIMPSSAQSLTHEGFPVDTGYALLAKLVAADLDGDGKLEILAAPENRKIKVFNTTGGLIWENVSGTIYLGDTARVPVVRNLTGDDHLEVLTYGNPGMSEPTFYIWDAFGSKVTEMMVGRALIPASPTETKEGIIITAVRKGTAIGIINYTGVHAFDKEGNRLWYLELGMNASTDASIPVVDLDEDDRDEAVVLTEDDNGIGTVWAIKVNNTQGTVLWNITLGGDARRVAAGDLNNDGRNEIVVLSTGGVYIFDSNGNQLYRFNINTNLSATPVIGDLDRDGVNEVIFASHNDKKIYIISNGIPRNFTISTSPLSTGRVASNVALGDLNGDGKLEIAAGDIVNNIYVWYDNGTIIEQKLIDVSETGTRLFSSAMIADLERDGNRELILGHDSGRIYVFTYNNTGDSTPPVTSNDVDASWHNSSVTVILSASDLQSGVFNTYYTIDGTLPTTSSKRGNVITLNESGIFTIKYFSVDKAENTEDVRNAMNQVKIDTVPPTTSDDADNLWHNTAAALNLTVMDSLSGVFSLYYSVDGTDNSSSGDVNLVFTEDGIHTVEYYGVDNAGNTESIKNAEVKIDLTPPITTDDSDGSWHNSNVTVNLSAIDNGSGKNTTYYKVTQVSMSPLGSLVSWLSGILGLEEGFTEGDTVFISDEGVFNISYYSVDNVGNIESVKTSAEVKIDKTIPATGASSYINGTVLDNSTQEAIPYAKVTTNTSINTTANSTGYYSFQLDAGSYTLTATSDPEYYANSSVIVEMVNTTLVQDIELVEKPRGTISGSVKNT